MHFQRARVGRRGVGGLFQLLHVRLCRDLGGLVSRLRAVPKHREARDLVGGEAEGILAREEVLGCVQHHLHHRRPHLPHHRVTRHLTHAARARHRVLRSERRSRERDGCQQRLAGHMTILLGRCVNTNVVAHRTFDQALDSGQERPKPGRFRLVARLIPGVLALAVVGGPAFAQARADAWRPQTVPLFGASYSPDIGLLMGAGIMHTRYGFRALPPSTRLLVEAAYATGISTYRIDVAGEFRRPLLPTILYVELRASGLESTRFYGVGNTTDGSQPDSGTPPSGTPSTRSGSSRRRHRPTCRQTTRHPRPSRSERGEPR